MISTKNVALSLVAFGFLFSLSADEVQESIKLGPSVAEGANFLSSDRYVDSHSISLMQAKELRDIFVKQAEIQVGGSAKIAQKLYIRGLEDRMYLTRLDGITIDGNMFHHQGNLLLSPFLIKSIDIYKGGSSVESGTGGLAGEISITSKNAFDLLKNNASFGSMINLGGQTNYGFDMQVATFGKLGDKAGLVAAYSYDNVPYYRAGHSYFNSAIVRSSPQTSHNAMLKFNALPTSHNSFDITYHFNRLDSRAPVAVDVIIPSENDLYRNLLDSHMLNAAYKFDNEDSFSFKWNNYYTNRSLNLVQLTQDHSEHNHTAEDHSHESEDGSFNLQSVGSDLVFANYFNEQTYFIKYGLNTKYIQTKAYGLDENTLDSSSKGKEGIFSYGGFVSSGVESEQIAFSFGSRYDWFTYDDKSAQRHRSGGFSPFAKLVFTPSDSLRFSLSHNSSYRGATPIDVQMLSIKQSSVNRHLSAEKLHHSEISAGYDNNTFYAKTSLYHAILQDFINTYANSGQGDFERKNMEDKIKILGYEVESGLKFERVQISFNLAQHFLSYKNKFITDTFELGAMVGRSYNLNLTAQPFKNVEIAWVSRFVEGISYGGYNLYYNSIEDISKKPFNTHDIYISYMPKQYLNLKLALLNITNSVYSNPFSPANELYAKSSGIPLYEPGFNVKGQISFYF